MWTTTASGRCCSGAAGPFLSDVLERLWLSLGAGREEQLRALAASWCVSSDVGHSVHPNYAEKHDPRLERAWIAEMDGEMVGCVFLVRKSEAVAKLRLLLVDPRARGRGLGRRLVSECVRFARAARYRKVVLWTNDLLHSARRIYEEEGFRRTASEKHRSFGADLVGETWELPLR